MGERRKASERREPVFGATSASDGDGAPQSAARGDDKPSRPRSSGDGKRKRRPKKSGGKRGRIGRIVYWGAVGSLWVLIAGIAVAAWVAAHLPPIQSLEVPKRPPSIQIVGLNGRVLATRGEMGGSAVPLRELPPYLPKAFLAIEDRRFYSHHGVDPFGIAWMPLIARLISTCCNWTLSPRTGGNSDASSIRTATR